MDGAVRERESKSGRDCYYIQLFVLFAITNNELISLAYTLNK